LIYEDDTTLHLSYLCIDSSIIYTVTHATTRHMTNRHLQNKYRWMLNYPWMLNM